jgi:hypothetical protein
MRPLFQKTHGWYYLGWIFKKYDDWLG